MHLFIRSFFSVLIFSTLIIFIDVSSAHAVRITKSRLEFNPGTRSDSFHIINNTGKPQTYRLEWIKYRMKEIGGLEKLTPENENDFGILWGEKMLRVAPKRITVAPGQSQIIRVALRRKKDMSKQEHRAHLHIIQELSTPDYGQKPKNKNGSSAILSFEQATAIPLIIRGGQSQAQAKITDGFLKATEKGLQINYTLHRIGEGSLYGDFDFTCLDDQSDDNTVIGQIGGIAIYPEINKRHLKYTIPKQDGKMPPCQNVEITYHNSTDTRPSKNDQTARTTARF